MSYYNTLKSKGLNQMLKIVGHNDDEFMTLYGIWKNPFSDFFWGDGLTEHRLY